MTGNQIDPKYIYISFDGYTINPDEFGDADIDITAGGDSSEVIKGKSGGHETVWHWDKIDQLTFTLFAHSNASYKLENYHNQSSKGRISWRLSSVGFLTSKRRTASGVSS